MELSGNLPPFPSPREPATRVMLEDLLRAAWALGHPNLLMAFARNSAMVVCLLQELHNKSSLKRLPLEPKSDADGKTVKKLSFCPFCLYNGSNDMSYMNHIVSGHYSTAYGCRKCLQKMPERGISFGPAAESASEGLHRPPQRQHHLLI